MWRPKNILNNELMINSQIINRGISDKKIINAFKKVDRKNFVSKEYIKKAYEDHPLPIGYNQTISQPYIVALMLKILEIQEDNKVLEIGAGSGYLSALICEIVKKGYLVAVERIKELAETATRRLKKYNNIKIIISDGSKGYDMESPYDRIIVSAASTEVPEALKDQLKIGGILVGPFGDRLSQELIKLKKINKNEFEKISFGGCVFVPLISDKDENI